MKSKIIGLLFLGCIQALFSQNIEPEWVNIEPTRGSDTKVLFDASGNIISFGETYHPGPVIGMITMKYDTDGNLLWQNKYDTYAIESIQDCIADAEGSVYSLCNSVDPFVFLSRFALVKYSAAGDTLWTFYYGGTQQITSAASDLLIDETGNIYVTGNVKYLETNDFGLMLLKLSPSGEILWESIYTEGSYGFTGLSARIIDSTFYLWGRTGSPQGTRLCCLTLEMNGNVLDFNVTDPYSDNFLTYYHIDEKGDFMVGDQCCEYKVTKFNSKGVKMWQYIKPVLNANPTGVNARLTCIKTDSENNVYAAGQYYVNDTFYTVVTTKLNELGDTIWERMLSIPDMSGASPNAMVFSNDKIFITGTISRLLPYNNYEFLLLQYDNEGNLDIGGRSDLEGTKNTAQGAAILENYLALSGTWYPDTATISSQQIVAKFNLPTSSVFQPSKSVQDIQIIPNPFRISVALSLEHRGGLQKGVLELLDAQGNLLFQRSVSLAPGNNFIEVDAFGDLPSGLYCFQVAAPGVTYVSKAIKL